MCVCVFCRAVRNKKYEKEKEKKKIYIQEKCSVERDFRS